MLCRAKGLFFLLALCLGLSASGARAQFLDPVVGYGYGSFLPYSVYTTESVPYYAMHPPVYYSGPVPRSYGYSPFPYPPSVMTPEFVEEYPGPIIKNPYIERLPAEPSSQRTATAPQRIQNPFVVADTDHGTTAQPVSYEGQADSADADAQLVAQLLTAWEQLPSEKKQQIREILLHQ